MIEIIIYLLPKAMAGTVDWEGQSGGKDGSVGRVDPWKELIGGNMGLMRRMQLIFLSHLLRAGSPSLLFNFTGPCRTSAQRVTRPQRLEQSP